MLPWYISKQCIHCCFWQEIVKPKVLELSVLLSEQLLATIETERSDEPECKRRICFSPFKPYLQLRETLLNNRSKSFSYLPSLQQQLFRPHFFLLQHQSIVKQNSTSMCTDLITSIHCKRRIVIMTDCLLFQIQMSQQNTLLCVEENYMTIFSSFSANIPHIIIRS